MQCLLPREDPFLLRISNTALSSDDIRQKCKTMNLSDLTVEVTSRGYIVETYDPTTAFVVRLIFSAEPIDD